MAAPLGGHRKIARIPPNSVAPAVSRGHAVIDATVILNLDFDIFPPACYSFKKIAILEERGMAVRKKQLRLVVTFHTTAGAMAAEQLCRKLGLEGRLISVPRSVTSDCGIAWSAPPDLRSTLEARFQEAGIDTAGCYELFL